MDAYTVDNNDSTAFNGYPIENYVDRELHRFPIDLRNVNALVEGKSSQTNNHVEGYNRRMKTVFPIHPPIQEFIRLLQAEHVFQQHQAEAS